MSHKKHDHIPLFSQYLDARIELLEKQVKKLNNVFQFFLDPDEIEGKCEEEECEWSEWEDEDEGEESDDENVSFCVNIHKHEE